MSSPRTVAASAHQQSLVRVAARALARAGLVHAYGHCSLRLDAAHFLVCAARPMGLIERESGIVVDINGELPEGVLGEVRIHQHIYRQRPDVNAVIRSMPRDVMTLSAAGITPATRHGMGSYFSPGVPLWTDPQLIRTDAQAEGVATRLGKASAVAMQGNGAVIAAVSLEEAVVLNWYLEDAARIELQLRAAGLGDAPVLDAAQCQQRATRAGRIFERMWEYLCAGDPEFSQVFD